LENNEKITSDVSIGYSMYTIPSNIPEKMLKKILKEDIFEEKILSKERKDMEYCNLGSPDLEGYYYDKDGNIYFEPGLQFHLKIKYFKELFRNKSKINGT
jgi:hypothetical protein